MTQLGKIADSTFFILFQFQAAACLRVVGSHDV